jgi:hypothetical protein
MSDPYKPMFGAPISDWFQWFAWHPVNTEDRGWRWLCWVWRRRCQKFSYLEGPDLRWFQNVVDPSLTPAETEEAA